MTDAFAQAWPTGIPEQALGRPLATLVGDRRASAAFATLALATVRDLVATPPERLLAVKGFGVRTFARVIEALEALRAAGAAPATAAPDALRLLPAHLLAYPTESLALPSYTKHALARLRLNDVESILRGTAVLAADVEIGKLGIEHVRLALDQLIPESLVRKHAPEREADSFAPLYEQCLAVLEPRERDLLERHLGRARGGRELAELAESFGHTRATLRALLDRACATLRERAAESLARLLDATTKELAVHDGIVTAAHITPGTVLHVTRREGCDPSLPLRFVALCFPGKLYVHRDALTLTSPRTLARARRAVRELVATRLPYPLAALEAELATRGLVVARGVLCHVLHLARLCVTIDRERGELVERVPDSIPDRLERILGGRTLPLVDLVFHYRDRHRRASRGKLLDWLRQDERFLELGRDQWTLREPHEDEILLVRAEASRIATVIATSGGRHAVRALRDGLSERTTYLIADCLKRDARLRYLGRGEFCARGLPLSRVLQDVVRDFHRAMGEVPRARFLQNQPEARRRVVAHLLRANRMFVELGPDRVDLLTNYPFDELRLARLLQTVDAELRRGRGYAHVTALKQLLDATDLSGKWLTEPLLLDLLRRHGNFELLPGGIVAQPALGLLGWIQQRGRDAIRRAGIGLTVGEILAEAPELAEFGDSLRELLEADPHVHSPDAMHYQVV